MAEFIIEVIIVPIRVFAMMILELIVELLIGLPFKLGKFIFNQLEETEKESEKSKMPGVLKMMIAIIATILIVVVILFGIVLIFK